MVIAETETGDDQYGILLSQEPSESVAESDIWLLA